MALSDTAIRTAKTGTRNYKMYDRDGVFLLVKTNGSKLWRFRYFMGGKEQLMALGEYPDVTLATARELCRDAYKKLASGIDPMAERRAMSEAKQNDEQQRKREQETSFESVARKWWIRWSVGKSARHAATTMRRLETDVFTKYGHKHIDEVTPAEIRELMLDVEGRGARDVAKRVHETTSQIFRFAIAHGIGTNNPAALFKPRDILLEARSENRARVDARDLPKLLADMDEYDGDAITRFGLRLMAYTFTRTSELIEAPWTEFDLDNARWEIPPERMKMDTPHIVPLAHQTVDVLKALKLLTGTRKHVFAGALDKEKPISNNTLLYALYRLGYQGRMTGHGFRGLASTILNENGFDEAHVELQLAHMKRNKVAAAYNHAKYLKQRAAMMQWWADYLDSQLARGRAMQLKRLQSA